jgi:lycopene cyclase domain-containing protein
MDFGIYTYLILNIGTLLGPLALSFDKKVAFFRSWKSLFPAMFITGAVFLIWDVLFTEAGVWHFNPDYVVGVYFLGLPIEEWMFFFTVPYASVFIYACVRAYFPKWELKKISKPLAWSMIAFALLIGVLNLDKAYTSVTAFLLATWFSLVMLRGNTSYLGHFFQSWLIDLVPLFIVNGVLTALPVVVYNNTENLSIRLGTVPIEDLFYNMLLLLMNVSLYEFFRQRGQYKPALQS